MMREGAKRAAMLATIAVASLSLVFIVGGMLEASRTARLKRLASEFALDRGSKGGAERARALERGEAYRVFALRREGRLSGIVFFLFSGRGARATMAMVLADGEGRALAVRIAEGRDSDFEAMYGKPGEKLSGDDEAAWNRRLGRVLGEARR